MSERSLDRSRTRPHAQVVGVLLVLLLVMVPWPRAPRASERRSELSQDYSGITLAALCLEGDNDSRRGVEAERECEQYIRGFLDALGTLQLEQASVSLPQLCLPAEIDALDAVRRNYTRWVFENFEQRESPAGAVLMESLQQEFACP